MIVAIVGAFIAFIATLCQTIIPIYFSSESSDFSVFVNPIDIEATPLESEILPSLLQIWNPELENRSKSIKLPPIVEVQNVHNVISPYKHSVYLKIESSNPNIYVEFDKPEEMPYFKTNMSVYIKNTNKSVIHYPIIVQGIGGNGKIRNCTFYVTYIVSDDYLKRGHNQTLMGRYEDAIKTYAKAIELNPKNAKAWLFKGLALSFLNKYDESIPAYDKAIELKPDYDEAAAAWVGKGFDLKNMHKYNESILAFNKALELTPNEWPASVAWFNKGEALNAIGRATEAEASFSKAKRLGQTG